MPQGGEVEGQAEAFNLEDLKCAVCMEAFHRCVLVHPCLHRFCSGCLSECLRYKTTCPICRNEVQEVERDQVRRVTDVHNSSKKILFAADVGKDLTMTLSSECRSRDVCLERRRSPSIRTRTVER